MRSTWVVVVYVDSSGSRATVVVADRRSTMVYVSRIGETSPFPSSRPTLSILFSCRLLHPPVVNVTKMDYTENFLHANIHMKIVYVPVCFPFERNRAGWAKPEEMIDKKILYGVSTINQSFFGVFAITYRLTFTLLESS